MRALSLLQPWASLLVYGAKKIETRSWRTDYRGWLAIHASLTFKPEYRQLAQEEPFLSALAIRDLKIETLPLGQIIGSVYLADCVRMGPYQGTYKKDGATFTVPPLDPDEYEFGDYTAGRYAWLCSRFVAYENPIKYHGSLGLWELPSAALADCVPDRRSYGEQV